jgi:hypothetical protein
VEPFVRQDFKVKNVVAEILMERSVYGKLVMKAKSAVLAVIGCVLVFLAGCKKPNVKQSIQTTDSNAPAAGEAGSLTAVWDGSPPKGEAMPDFFEGQPAGKVFPESMVGVWEVVMDKEKGSKWGIKFEPDGSIKKIIHSLAGPVKIADGGVGGTGPDESTYYLFAMGPCESRYMPDKRTIKVKIILDYFIMKSPDGELEGRIEDYFEGPVCEDGKTWNVKWWSFGWLKDAAVPDINLTKANPEPLVFEKVEIKPKVTADSNAVRH